MKVKKFNEGFENIKDCCMAMIVDSNNYIIRSAAFETEADMNNWLLNTVNEELVHVETKRKENITYNEENEPIFIDVADAINWYQDYFDCNIHYDIESQYIVKEPLLYGVELTRKMNKYNL